MDRGARLFWSILCLLVAATAWFTVGVERQRAAHLARSESELATGALVDLGQVVDGDTVTVRAPGRPPVVVRLVGVKALSRAGARDAASRVAIEAESALASRLREGPVRVVLGDPRQDARGRVLAQLFREDADVGLELVGRGLALVYLPYPFAEMGAYLEQQARARAEHRGLWAEPLLAARADALIEGWQGGRE
ncbi:MAG: thermonuclease family protein [Deltaproteobacteria bacterium]|nr:thermonuclease family protein [Deltaproteobacteria bacterium]